MARVTQEYKELYQHLHIDRKGNRELVLREMEMGSELTSIHHEGLEKLVNSLKQTMSKKNEEIGELVGQTAKLRTDLLRSTVQYNDTIS